MRTCSAVFAVSRAFTFRFGGGRPRSRSTSGTRRLHGLPVHEGEPFLESPETELGERLDQAGRIEMAMWARRLSRLRTNLRSRGHVPRDLFRDLPERGGAPGGDVEDAAAPAGDDEAEDRR